MLSRTVFVLAMVAAAMAARQVPVSTANRKVNFLLRSNDRFSSFYNFVRTHSFRMQNYKTDDSDNDMVIAIATTNAAMDRNTARLRNDPAGVYLAASHVARVDIDNDQGIEVGMSADEINRMFKREVAVQSASFLNEFSFFGPGLPRLFRQLNTAQFDLVLYRNRFNAYVNGLVVEEVIACTDGYILVVDGLLENPIEDYGTYSFLATLNIFLTTDSTRRSHFLRFNQYVENNELGTGGPVTDFEELARLLQPLSRPGKNRQAGLVLFPLNRAMKKRSVTRQLKQLAKKNLNASVKVFMNHICLFPKGEGYLNRADIVEKASASPNGWSCTNALGNELVFTVGAGRYDGLAVNGVPVAPAVVDASLGRDTILALDGVLIPELKDAWDF